MTGKQKRPDDVRILTIFLPSDSLSLPMARRCILYLCKIYLLSCVFLGLFLCMQILLQSKVQAAIIQKKLLSENASLTSLSVYPCHLSISLFRFTAIQCPYFPYSVDTFKVLRIAVYHFSISSNPKTKPYPIPKQSNLSQPPVHPSENHFMQSKTVKAIPNLPRFFNGSLLFANTPSSSHVSALSQSRWYHFSLFRLAFCTILTFAKKTAVRRFRTTVFSSSAPPIQHPPQHGIYIDFLHIFRRNHFCSTDFCPIPQINQLPNFRSRLYWRFYR